MKRIPLILLTVGMLIAAAFVAHAQTGYGQQGYPYGPYMMGPGMMGGYGMGPGMMGGYGGYGMGPGMMGGYGGHGMMGGYGGYGMGPGMMRGYGGYGMGPGYGPGYGTGLNQRAWQEMTPKQREEWQGMRYKYYKDTLQLRQKIANKQMELHALWNSPQPDQAKIKALSNEINDLRAQLAKERDQYLMECRQKFGDLGWSCPALGGRGN